MPDPSEAGRVLDAELRQLDGFLEELRPESIPTLYVGGGTPSVVPRKELEVFLQRLLCRLPSHPGEFTIEANPESLDESFIDILLKVSATRISLGMQTFSGAFLEILGRRAVPADNLRAIELLAEKWPGEVNLDLMYGFPGQSAVQAAGDADSVLAGKPGHVSLYALTPESGTPYADDIDSGIIRPMDDDGQEEIRSLLHGKLTGRGYENYEISNYALPGKRCLHNTGYWEMRPYIGIGPGGVSTIPSPSGGISRRRGRENIAAFIADPFCCEEESLSSRDFLVDYILMGLRTSRGIDLGAFSRIFGFQPEELFPETLKKHEVFLSRAPGRFGLNGRGRRLLNTILVDFLDEIDGRGFDSPIRWP